MVHSKCETPTDLELQASQGKEQDADARKNKLLKKKINVLTAKGAG